MTVILAAAAILAVAYVLVSAALRRIPAAPLQLPTDPNVLPNQAGTAGTWNFQPPPPDVQLRRPLALARHIRYRDSHRSQTLRRAHLPPVQQRAKPCAKRGDDTEHQTDDQRALRDGLDDGGP